jgi:peptide deformylase
LTANREFCTIFAMLKILTLGDERLTKRASVVGTVDKMVVDLAHAMIEAMQVGNGIGLAGPQVGELKRIFVCHVQRDETRIFINPEIIATSQELVTYEEGCLSIPGIYADVVRPERVTVQALNENGKPFRLEADGVLARVVQHEIDHLNGVLFLDHISEKKRQRLLKSYLKSTEGNAAPLRR